MNTMEAYMKRVLSLLVIFSSMGLLFISYKMGTSAHEIYQEKIEYQGKIEDLMLDVATARDNLEKLNDISEIDTQQKPVKFERSIMNLNNIKNNPMEIKGIGINIEHNVRANLEESISKNELELNYIPIDITINYSNYIDFIYVLFSYFIDSNVKPLPVTVESLKITSDKGELKLNLYGEI